MTRDRLRRFCGATLCAAGALLTGYAGWRYADGAMRADGLRRQWAEQQARNEVALARERARRGLFAAIERLAVGAPIARLSIPRIALDEIVVEGVGDDELNIGPGHLPGSAIPGMSGNAVISGHRDRHFSRLDQLQLGDTIRTESGHLKGSWIIVSRRIIGRETPALFETKEPRLTLTTCWPVRYFGSAPDRLIITAKPLGDGRTGASTKTADAT